MLVCLSCNIEFKEDKKFCSYCGGSLTTKEDVAPKKKDAEKEEEKSEQKLVCPNCKIMYDFGRSCIQCGADLISEIPTKKKEESIPTKAEQVRNSDEGLICPACKVTYPHGNFCPKCGSPLLSQKLGDALERANATCNPEPAEEAIPLAIIKNHPEMPRKNLICPQCKIIYERGSTCVRCGSSLVAEGQEPEKPEPPVMPDQDLDPSPSQGEFSDSTEAPKKQVV